MVEEAALGRESAAGWHEMTGTDSASAGVLDALESLNRISATINRRTVADAEGVAQSLRLIVESAVKVITGASAVVFAYDQESARFDSTSRVAAGGSGAAILGDVPREDGLGRRSIAQQRPVLSYEEDLPLHPSILAAGVAVVACFPLLIGDEAVGVLYVYLSTRRQFSSLELLLLENFVQQAASAVYHARRISAVQHDLARKEDELTRLRRAGLLISSRLRLEETLEAILQMALEVTNAQYGIFRLVDRSGTRLEKRAMAGERLGRPATEPLSLSSPSIMGWVAQHRQPLRIADLRAEPWAQIYYPLDRELQMRSELAVPLIDANGRLEGVLNLESPAVNAFSEADSHLLQSLATQAVIAIQQARLLDALQDVAERLLSQPCQSVLDHLAELACDLLYVPVSAVWTPVGERLELQAACGAASNLSAAPYESAIDALTAAALSGRQPVAMDSVPPNGTILVPALAVPLLSTSEGQPAGAFCVYDPERESWSDWDKKVLSILGHYAALAWNSAVRQHALRLAQEQRAVAETFAAMGDIAANSLHHLNNKVGAIPVRVEGIQDKCGSLLAEQPYLANSLNEIERSATTAMAAVRESLSLLRPIELTQVRVSDCVAQAIVDATLPAAVRVVSKHLEALPAVLAGHPSLVLVMVNLLQNAAEAMRGEGQVTVAGRRLEDMVEIALSDTGQGIPAAVQERVFEFDYSGRQSERRGKLGFGLWWVRTLMTRLGGSVTVSSDGIRGTTFRLLLPVAEVKSE
jgi:GAF domain-containing protein